MLTTPAGEWKDKLGRKRLKLKNIFFFSSKRLTTPAASSENYQNLIITKFVVNPKFKNQTQVKDLRKFTKLLLTPAEKKPK